MALITKDQLQRTTAGMTDQQKVDAVRKLMAKGYTIEGISPPEPQPIPKSEMQAQQGKPWYEQAGDIANSALALPGQALKVTGDVLDPVANVNRLSKAVSGSNLLPSELEVMKNTAGAVGDFASGAAQTVGQGAMEYAVKPAVKATAMAGYGGLQSIRQVPNLLNYDAFMKEGEKQRNESADIWGLGEINPQKDAKNTAGTAIDFGATLIPVGKGVKLLPKVGKAALQGLLQGSGKEMQKQESTFQDIATRGLTEGALAGLVTGVTGLIGNKLNKAKEVKLAETQAKSFEKAIEKAKSLGIEERDINYIKELPASQQDDFIKLMEQAKQNATNYGAPDPFKAAGQGVEDFIPQAQDVLKKKGSAIGEMRKGLGDLSIKTAQDQKNALQRMLREDLNAKILPDGTLDFSSSRIKANTAAQKQFQDIFDLLKHKNINARDLEARTGQINELTGLLKSSGFKSSEANALLSKSKGLIDEAVGTVAPEFKSAKADFANLVKLLNKVKGAAKVPLGNGEVTYAGDQMLSKLLGNAPRKSQQGVDAIKKIAEQYGLQSPGDLNQKAILANIAARATGAVNPRSLEGSTKGAISSIARLIPGVGAGMNMLEGAQAAKQITEILSGNAAKVKSDALVNLLKATPKAAVKKAAESAKKPISDAAMNALAQLFSMGARKAVYNK